MLQRFHADIKNDKQRAVLSTLLSTPQVVHGVHPTVRCLQGLLHAKYLSADALG